MNVKSILRDIIEERIANLESDGSKVRLKTVIGRRVLVSFISAVLFLLTIWYDALFFSFVVLVICFVILYHINNVSVITELARKSPDTPIAKIIEGDMK